MDDVTATAAKIVARKKLAGNRIWDLTVAGFAWMPKQDRKAVIQPLEDEAMLDIDKLFGIVDEKAYNAKTDDSATPERMASLRRLASISRSMYS